MNLYRIINLVILGFATAFMVVGIYQFFEGLIHFSDLIPHKGIVESKYLSSKYFTHRNSVTRREEIDSTFIFNFKIVGRPQLYTASRYPQGINNLIEVGDTIDFYTRTINFKYGNTVNITITTQIKTSPVRPFTKLISTMNCHL